MIVLWVYLGGMAITFVAIMVGTRLRFKKAGMPKEEFLWRVFGTPTVGAWVWDLCLVSAMWPCAWIIWVCCMAKDTVMWLVFRDPNSEDGTVDNER